jgi:TM2 domain-containing membrane protein YozV
MSAWHVRAGGKTIGPISSTQLKQAVEAGKVPANAQVRKDGVEDWQPITKIKGLNWPEVSIEPRALAPLPNEVIAPQPAPIPAYQQPMFQPAAAPVPQSIVNVHVAAPTMRRWSRGTAILLSLIVPGLGQAYKGQIINGLVWFVVTIAGYIMLIVPGVILHILCLVGASWGDETR